MCSREGKINTKERKGSSKAKPSMAVGPGLMAEMELLFFHRSQEHVHQNRRQRREQRDVAKLREFPSISINCLGEIGAVIS